MQVIVLATESQKAAWLKEAVNGVTWIQSESEFLQYPAADAYIDLQYFNSKERNDLLLQPLPKLVLINSVMDTLAETNFSFVRFNGWNTFLSSPIIEAACQDDETKARAEAVFALFQKKPEWLPDEPGFITARVVSMIINEAFLALGEGVSTKDEINTAMKLGTAYPYGPFEWAAKIGVQNVVLLLQKLRTLRPQYTPSELLLQEMNHSI